MARKAKKGGVKTVALTGATGELGRLLLPRLLSDASVGKVLALGLRPPPGDGRGKLEFRRVDLSRPEAELELTDALEEGPLDALYHLAMPMERITDPSLAHELEVIGTMRVLAAAGKARVPRLVLPSATMLYGARSAQPSVLPESTPLHGCPASRFVTDKVQVEEQAARFAERHPEARVIVLRFAPLLGPELDNPATRMLRRRVVPTLLGYNPLWQTLHAEDAAAALHLSLNAEARGAFNIVADGVLPLSALIQQAGARPLPLPLPLARAALRTLNGLGVTSVPLKLMDYFHYSWVADGRRARQELGFRPQYSARQAAAALRGS